MSMLTLQPRVLQQDLSQYQGRMSPTLARILSARDVAINQFDLELKHLLPANLLGLDEAVQRIDQAIDAQQQIVIVGDYDADGATSTALMILVLRQLGAKVDYIVPDRFKYGYGLTPAIAELAFERVHPQLLITVDNGISSHAGVARCHELGMDVVITDHHLTTKQTPQACAVVNPNQLGCHFASKSLVGVGVAFYVLACLATHRQKHGKSSVKLNQYLDLVALGTVADVGKLDYNNRILVKAGLNRIRKRQCRAGILALLEVAGKAVEQMTAQDFGFILGPRINAAGRMDSMQIGIECLLSEDLPTAYRYAYQLDELNQNRRQVEQKMRDQADRELDKYQQLESLPPALVLFEPTWHQGVIGIVAGRLKDHYHRPSIVFAPDEDGIHIKGSARSIAGIHIRDCIERVAEQQPELVRFFGGHAAAAGLTIQRQHFEAFQQAFIKQMQSLDEQLFQPILYTDGELSDDEFDLDFVAQIQQFEPWGQGFEPPVFCGIFAVLEYQWLKDSHLKLKLQLDDGRVVEAIGFNLKNKFANPTQRIELVYSLEKNEFRGEQRLQLKIIHINNISKS
ncbi:MULTISPECIES: single-stranded-DNA-specific exonuclease RecJ [unclassified Acinetobacter]|uniref:single-stranded-DNA-specific exonuclease RecJ n=1 Tax=unclassified Acinetobacter TaxID=196816 RepID=UPI0035B7B27E